MAESILETTAIRVTINDQGALQDLKRVTQQLKQQAASMNVPLNINTGPARQGMSSAAKEAQALGREVNTLRARFQASGKQIEQTTAKLTAARDKALALSLGFKDDSVEALAFARAARTAEATVTQMTGGMTRLGLASQAALAVQRGLEQSMYYMGPAGATAAGALGVMTRGFEKVSPAALGGAAALIGVGVAAHALLAKGIPEVGQFQSALQLLRATGNNLSSSGLTQALDDAAAAAGKAGTQFSRAELATGLARLVKAGLDLKDAMALLAPSMQLAVESGQSFEQASTLLLTNLRQFSLNATDASQAAGALGIASLRARDNAQALSKGLATVGPIAQQAGLTLDQTLAALVTLSNKGLNAADIGARGLRTTITHLINPSKQAAAAMADMGIATKDAAGHQRSFDAILADTITAANKYGISIDQTTGQVVGQHDAIALLAKIVGQRGLAAIAGLAAAADNATNSWQANTQAITDSKESLKQYADTLLTNNIAAAQTALTTATKNLAEAFTLALAPALSTAMNFWAKVFDSMAKVRQSAPGAIQEIRGLTSALSQATNATQMTDALDALDKKLKGSAKDAFDAWRGSINLANKSLKELRDLVPQAQNAITKGTIQDILSSKSFMNSRLQNPGIWAGYQANQVNLAGSVAQQMQSGDYAQAANSIAAAADALAKRGQLTAADASTAQKLIGLIMQLVTAQNRPLGITPSVTVAGVNGPPSAGTLGADALSKLAKSDVMASMNAQAQGTADQIVAAAGQLTADETQYGQTFKDYVAAWRQVLSRSKTTLSQVKADAKALADALAAEQATAVGARQRGQFTQPWSMGGAGSGATNPNDFPVVLPNDIATATVSGFVPTASMHAKIVAVTQRIRASVDNFIVSYYQYRANQVDAWNKAHEPQTPGPVGGTMLPPASKMAGLEFQGPQSVTGAPGYAGFAGARELQYANRLARQADAAVAAAQAVQGFTERLDALSAKGRDAAQAQQVLARYEASLVAASAAGILQGGPTYDPGMGYFGPNPLTGRGYNSWTINRLRAGGPMVPGTDLGPPPGARSSYDSYTRAMFATRERQREAAAEAARIQKQAALSFAQTIIQAGQGFENAIVAFAKGNIGGGISGLAGAVGGILSVIPGVGPLIGGIVAGGGQLIGGFIDAITGNTDAVKQNTAALLQNVPTGFKVEPYIYDVANPLTPIGQSPTITRQGAAAGGVTVNATIQSTDPQATWDKIKQIIARENFHATGSTVGLPLMGGA